MLLMTVQGLPWMSMLLGYRLDTLLGWSSYSGPVSLVFRFCIKLTVLRIVFQDHDLVAFMVPFSPGSRIKF